MLCYVFHFDVCILSEHLLKIISVGLTLAEQLCCVDLKPCSNKAGTAGESAAGESALCEFVIDA